MLTWQLRLGDVRTTLAMLPERSIQCCVTSPPYWGLRDYGTGTWEGGDATCIHRVPATGSTQNKANNNQEGTPFRDVCGLCGARRIDQQIGLESTPEAYVEALVEVFLGVRRVLKDDGTLWLNLGDSYARTGESNVPQTLNPDMNYPHHAKAGSSDGVVGRGERPGSRVSALSLKPKDLVGIPWMVAFALRNDGWYLRSDIIWQKANPMPESVTDRPTKAHEYLFLLTKSAKYYYDAEAIAENSISTYKSSDFIPRSQKDVQETSGLTAAAAASHANRSDDLINGTRNKRSVWTIATAPYPEAHFATYPPLLIEPCILAGSRLGDTVLDPFTGSGTTGEVALRAQRHFVGLELNAQYVALARRRLSAAMPLFAEEVDAIPSPPATVAPSAVPSLLSQLLSGGL
jgi:DNA modification methylase